jgi:hypothetical protein
MTFRNSCTHFSGARIAMLACLTVSTCGLNPAGAVPITVNPQAIAPPNCEVPTLPPTQVDELGTLVFPANELITASWTLSPAFVCQANAPAPPVLLRMTNTVSPPASFPQVWYVASKGTTFENYEMLVDLERAVKIDSLGVHQPLINESLIANNIFEPGETWTFILDGWRNVNGFAPDLLDSPGVVGTGDFTSSGSIIAIPEPTGVLVWVALSAAGWIRRRACRSTSRMSAKI